MPSPLSLDLRQKIIEVHTEEDISQRQLAERFRVSLSSIQRLLKRFRNDEGIEPKGHGGGYPPTFSPEQLGKVRALVEANHDATLSELCELVAEQEGETVSVSTMWRIIEGLGITRKKKRFMLVSAIQSESKS
jgi:transposase